MFTMLGIDTAWTEETEFGRRKQTRNRSATTAKNTSSFYERGNGQQWLPRCLRPGQQRAQHSLHPSPPVLHRETSPRGQRRRVSPPPLRNDVVLVVLSVVALSISDVRMSPTTTTSAFRMASLSRRRIVGAAASAPAHASVSIRVASSSSSGVAVATTAAASTGGYAATDRGGASRFGLGLSATTTTAGGGASADLEGTTDGDDERERRRAWEDRVVQWCLYRIRECNKVPEDVISSWLDLVVDGEVLGKVRPDLAERLDEGPTFSIQTTTGAAERVLTLSDAAGTTCEERTAAVGVEMSKLRDDGTVRGWRDELYPVSTGFGRDPVFLVERAAAPHLGVQQYGPHINGYVRDNDGRVRMWMGRRAEDKSKYPGMLDHIAAGGQPHGVGPMDNVVKECHEEAVIPEELSRRAVPAGAVTYEKLAGPGGGNQLDRNCLFCYDLELPSDFVPAAVDGEVEVEEFFLWDLDQVAESMRPDFADPIKPNCYLVVIDFLLRWGYITPESPGYLDVLRELRSGPCM